jgi:hypothetical protein
VFRQKHQFGHDNLIFISQMNIPSLVATKQNPPLYAGLLLRAGCVVIISLCCNIFSFNTFLFHNLFCRKCLLSIGCYTFNFNCNKKSRIGNVLAVKYVLDSYEALDGKHVAFCTEIFALNGT